MSQLNPSEISSVLKEKIAGLDLSAERKMRELLLVSQTELYVFMAWEMSCLENL